MIMNFCTKCGAPVTPGTKFCTKCGAPVEADQQSRQQAVPPQQSRQQAVPPQQPPVQKKPVNKGLIIGIVAAAAATVVVIFAIIYLRNSYNMKDYCKVDFTGYENYGTAEADIRSSKLEDRIGKKYGFSEKDIDDYEDLSEFGSDFRKAMQIESFVDSMEPKVSAKDAKQGQLSNGDTVKIKISYSRAMAKKLGIHIHGTTYTVKVKGLKEGKVTDPFDSVSITYTGALPYLVPEVNVADNSPVSADEFTITTDDDSDYLTKAGQEFTVEFTGENDPANGLIFARKEKKYKAGKVSTYITKASELTDDDRKQLIGRTDRYNAENEEEFDGLKFVGCAVAVSTSEDDYDNQNRVYAVYSYKYTDWWGDTTTAYMTIVFSDVMKQSDGSLWFYDGNTYIMKTDDESVDEVHSSIEDNAYLTYDDATTDYDKSLK